MSLKPQAISPVPAETARVARAAYPKRNVYMQMRDVLGSIYTDEDFADLFPKDGQPAQTPWRLALVTVLQFVENLSVGATEGMKFQQPRAHLIRRFDVYQGGEHFDIQIFLRMLSVQFVRLKQYTVYPYPFHLINIYVESILRFGN